MKFNLKSFATIVFLTFKLITCNSLFAQLKDSTVLFKPKVDNQFKLSPAFSSGAFQSSFFNAHSFGFLDLQSTYSNQYYFSKLGYGLSNNLSFIQNKEVVFLPNLGGFENFNNSLIFKTENNFTLEFDFGILKQNTVLTPFQPNLQFTFGTKLEYEINNWLGLYVYGQYLVPKGKNANALIDPLTYMSPLFFQTEIGGGLKAKYKSINADVGLKQMFDTQFKQSAPVKSMNTKISIGF